MTSGLEKIVVFALGGNQIGDISKQNTEDDEKVLTYPIQYDRVRDTAMDLSDYIVAHPESGFVITHGNGPQSGIELLMAQAAIDAGTNYEMELFEATRKNQGSIGSWIQRELNDELGEQRAGAITTYVEVNKDDPDFNILSKPIGPFYKTREKVQSVFVNADIDDIDKKRIKVTTPDKKEYIFEKKPKGYRQVVASPEPKKILDFNFIYNSLQDSKRRLIPIAVGGGGIPVISENGRYRPINAVIDKDKASALLSYTLKEESGKDVDLVILTDQPCAYINFEKENKQGIRSMNLKQAHAYFDQNHFEKGSMGPKIQAAIYAIKKGVNRVIITQPDLLDDAMKGEAGTTIAKDALNVLYNK